MPQCQNLESKQSQGFLEILGRVNANALCLHDCHLDCVAIIKSAELFEFFYFFKRAWLKGAKCIQKPYTIPINT